jgi:hyperosmotically inducible protein
MFLTDIGPQAIYCHSTDPETKFARKERRRRDQVATGITEITKLEEHTMNAKLVMSCLVCGMLLGPAVTIAQDSDADRSHPKAFMKDSAITTEIKTKLAAEHITSLGRVHVDTDKDGVVWLSGSARTQEAIDKAVSIARDTNGVKDVHNHIKIKKDD